MPKKKLLRVMRGEVLDVPPVWLMRQAGRYLPEYLDVRAQAGSFLELCYTPELAEEVTLQPIRRFGFDAAIVFADILLVAQALGLDLWFVEGEGPRLAWPGGEIDPNQLKPVAEIDVTLGPVYETVARLKHSLPAETALIGFAGAPWTVATYMIAGRGTPDQTPARRMMYERPEAFTALIDRIVEATVHYLSAQIEAGAEVIKLFDSWAGVLSEAQFTACSVDPVRRITAALKAMHPDVPVIGFPRGAGAKYQTFADRAAVDCVALDAQVPLEWARKAMPRMPLQGNLDPMLMVVGGDTLRRGAEDVLAEMRDHPHIFNLGHGITPDADPAHVETLLKVIRG